MSGTSLPHWATGPAELLEHAVGLLGEDSDKNRRLAMIGIDNAVELILKTYLDLPKRVTGLQISRKEKEEITSSFPALLDGIEKHAGDRIVGINLGEIEWFHRLRNELYHQGNGLTVERRKVEAYAEVALALFSGLFDAKIALSVSPGADRLGRFLQAWVRIERAITQGNALRPLKLDDEALNRLGLFSFKERGAFLARFEVLRLTRNALVHGISDPNRAVTDEVLQEVERVATLLERDDE